MRFLSLLLAVVWPLAAHAHVQLGAPTKRTTEQKTKPCGIAGSTRGTNVSTFAPGETITVTWQETINHPGYFRIAFQPNGSNFPMPAAGPSPNNQCRNANNSLVNCPAGVTPCGLPPLAGVNEEGTDATTGAIILKDRIPDGTSSIQVTLPNMECNNCTLQLVQVMHDKCPYVTNGTVNDDDLYYQCADITLASGTPMVDAGMTGGPDAPMGGGGGGSTTSGGCSTSGGAGLLVGLGLLGLIVRRRRA